MMRWHRLAAILAALLLVYVVGTGIGIQLADMRALVMHAPDTDPDMLMMRQHINGPPNYGVVSAPDYTAARLPAGLDYIAAIGRAMALGRAAAPGAQVRMVELRMAGDSPAGHVQMGDKHLIFDLRTGAALDAAYLPPPPPTNLPAARAWFKYQHKFTYLGRAGTGLNALAGIALAMLIITGLVHYVRLYKARARSGRHAAFWRGGGWWRSLHRWNAIGAVLFVTWIAVSGLALSIDNFGAFIHISTHRQPSEPGPFDGDMGAPLSQAQLPTMTRATLRAFQQVEPDTGVKVLRLRYFVGYPQGVVVAADASTTQWVFNTKTGARMSMSEKGYPDLNFPSGWEWHQRLKQIHRGDVLGLSGRWLDLLGALSLLYLIVSGSVMYYQLWARRNRGGRKALIWK